MFFRERRFCSYIVIKMFFLSVRLLYWCWLLIILDWLLLISKYKDVFSADYYLWLAIFYVWGEGNETQSHAITKQGESCQQPSMESPNIFLLHLKMGANWCASTWDLDFDIPNKHAQLSAYSHIREKIENQSYARQKWKRQINCWNENALMRPATWYPISSIRLTTKASDVLRKSCDLTRKVFSSFIDLSLYISPQPSYSYLTSVKNLTPPIENDHRTNWQSFRYFSRFPSYFQK
jgi:hypothetical protein